MSIINRFTESSFIRSVAVLLTGTVIAQLISFAISPILTRLYLPDEFADYNLYMRIIGFIAALATARYELSLPLPKKDEHSYLLYRISFKIALCMLIGLSFLTLFYFLFSGFDTFLVSFAAICIASAFFLIISNLGTNWSIRKKDFKRISIYKMTNSGTNNVMRWLFGALGFGSFGLMLGGLIGHFSSSLVFVPKWLKIKSTFSSYKSTKKTKVLLSIYKEFPTINLPHSLVDLGRDLLIATLLILYFDKNIFGWYSHSYTMLSLPASIIGLSIGQVFYSRCSELASEGKSTLPLLKKTIKTLILIAIIPFSIIFYYGEPLFAFVFGDNWANSGNFSEIMSIWFITGFLCNVVSTLPTVLHRQKEFFYLGILTALIQIVSFGVLPLYFGTSQTSFEKILWIVSICQSAFFIFVLYCIFSFAKKGVRNLG